MTVTPVRNTLDRSVAEALAQNFSGPIIEPEDEAYEDARKIWNASISKHPALVVRPTGTSDVRRPCGSPGSTNSRLRVRCGGHSIAGFSTSDGGTVIDLSLMKGILVDPSRRRAQVQAGVVWKELDRETQALASP